MKSAPRYRQLVLRCLQIVQFQFHVETARKSSLDAVAKRKRNADIRGVGLRERSRTLENLQQ
jgi:hypothetical protein